MPDSDPGDPVNEFDYTWQSTADSMQTATYTTYLGANGTFVQNNANNGNFNYWPNAHVLQILVDGYTRTGDEAYLSKMKALVEGIKIQNGGTYSNVFNDDMLWLGNACVRAYKASGDHEYLDVAQFLWNDVLQSYSDVFGGGITWKKDTPMQKNAVSNGPAAVLGMRLYEIDKDTTYLNLAKSIYDWESNNLVDPVTGLVWDNMSEENGVITIQKDWVFTYNMGTWIGAGVKLYEATGDQKYLNNSLKSAKTLITSPKLTKGGILRDEGQGDGGLFRGILVRYFTELIELPDISESDRKEFVKFLKFNATILYDYGLKRPQMLAGPYWAEQPSGSVDLTTQLSGVMLMEAAAKLDKESLF